MSEPVATFSIDVATRPANGTARWEYVEGAVATNARTDADVLAQIIPLVQRFQMFDDDSDHPIWEYQITVRKESGA